MNSRRKKIGTILQLHHKRLDERVAELNQQREAHRQAEAVEQREREAVGRATAYLQRMAHSVTTAADWREGQAWLDARLDEHDRAQRVVARADAVVRQAHHAMVLAHHDVKRIELLDQQLARTERRAFELAEQKSNDELVTLRFAEQRRAATSD